MFSPYALLPRCLRWCCRFRQRKGYGVHSPFAFTWITEVVYRQREQYYAYAALSQEHHAWQGQLSEKDARLLFRIANHQCAMRILVVGSGGAREMAYLKAARPSATFTQESAEMVLAAHPSLEDVLRSYDLVLWMSETPPLFPVVDAQSMVQDAAPTAESGANSERNANLGAKAVFILLFPYAHKARQAAWQQLLSDRSVQVSFDLHRLGVAFQVPRLHRQHYVVNYF